MGKVLIVLSGVSNSGKSTTLKMLISLIINEFNVTSIQYEGTVDYQTAKQYLSNTHESPGDWLVIFRNINNKDVAIHTAGDSGTHMSKSLGLLNNHDIVICASKSISRKNYGSVGELHKYIISKPNIEIYPFSKVLNGQMNSRLFDKLTCDAIYRLLKNII